MERVSGAALRFVCVYVCRATRVEKSEEKNEKMGEGRKKERKKTKREIKGGEKKEKVGGERVRLITI